MNQENTATSAGLAIELANVVLPAYAPCEAFEGGCASMRWIPEKGHLPRGLRGATGSISEVKLVLVCAEPGNPFADEAYQAKTTPIEHLKEAIAASNRYLEQPPDKFARNLRLIMDLAWPGKSFHTQLRKTWLTESVLCSAPVEGGPVSASVVDECHTRFLQPQLGLLPNARIVALGHKARGRLTRAGWRSIDPDQVSDMPRRAGDHWFVSTPHPSHRFTKRFAIEEWKKAVAGLDV